MMDINVITEVSVSPQQCDSVRTFGHQSMVKSIHKASSDGGTKSRDG